MPQLTRTDAPRTSHIGRIPSWLPWAGLVAALLYGIPSIWMLRVYLQPAFDLAIYDQTLWLIAHGETFQTVGGAHILGGHFSPVLYVLSPISEIPGGAVPELAFQALVIALGVYPAWKLAERLGSDARWFVFIYAVHPAIINGAWFGWRPWNIAVPVFMWACYWIVDNPSFYRILVSGLTLLLFREDLATWVGLLVLVLYFARRLKTSTLIKSAVSLGGATALVLFVLLPALSPVDGYFFTSESQTGLPGLPQVTSSVVLRMTFLLLPLMIRPTRLNWKLVLPLAIPIAGLLYRAGNALTTFYQYDMMFVPLLLVIVGLSTEVVFRPGLLALGSLVTLLAFGALRPIPPQQGGNPFRYDQEVVTVYDAVRAKMDSAPGIDYVSVVTPPRLLAHYSERTNAFVYPHPVDIFRDSEGTPVSPHVKFSCPEPGLVVTQPAALSPAWLDLIDEGYTMLNRGSPIGVWSRDELPPNKPCSAVWVED